MNRREALRTFGTGSALGLGTFAVITAAGCAPTLAPAAGVLVPAPAQPDVADPLLDLVNLYRSTRSELDALYPEGGVAFDAEMDRLVDPLWHRLKGDTPAATTEAGALAALRLAHEEMRHSPLSLEEPLVAAALAYFDGRSAS